MEPQRYRAALALSGIMDASELELIQILLQIHSIKLYGGDGRRRQFEFRQNQHPNNNNNYLLNAS